MFGKIGKIVLNAVLSFIVFFLSMVVLAIAAGPIVGLKMLADGSEELNGGGATTTVLLAIAGIVTVAFAILFHKFITKYKVTKVKG